MSVRAWLYPTRFFSTGTETEITVTELGSFGLQTEDPILGNIMPKKVSLKCLNYDGSLDYLRYKRDSFLTNLDNFFTLIEGIEGDYKFFKIIEIIGDWSFQTYDNDYYNPRATTGVYCIPPTPYRDSPYFGPSALFGAMPSGGIYVNCSVFEWEPLFLKIEIDNGTDPVYTGYYYIDFGVDSDNVEFDDENLTVTIQAEPMESLVYRLLEHIDPVYVLNEEYDIIRRSSAEKDDESTSLSERFYDGVPGETAYFESYVWDARRILELLVEGIGFTLDLTSEIDFGFMIDWEAYGTRNGAFNRQLSSQIVNQVINLFGGDLVFNAGGIIDVIKRTGNGSVSLTLNDKGRTLSKEASYRSPKGMRSDAQKDLYFYSPQEEIDSYGKYFFSFGTGISGLEVKKPALFLFKQVTGTWRSMSDSEIDDLFLGYITNYYETVEVAYFGLFTELKKTFTYKGKTHLIVSMEYDEQADVSTLTCRVIE